ncbi:MAG TPA: MFS transporter, partial [Candidatus Angelobacter sp.]|nr:MFS transporter [Candidatus Angelobacter sp.]
FVRLPLNPLIGYVYKKVNFRKAILFAVILSGITTISYGLVQNFYIWVILRSFWGLSWSLFKLGAYLLILQLSSNDNRGSFMGSYNGLYRLGSLLGMLLGGLFADLFGIRIISLILGFSAFMSIPIIFNYIPTTLQASESVNAKSDLLANIGLFLNKKLLMILVTAFLLTIFLDGMLTAILSHIIEEKYTDKIDILGGIVVGASTLAGFIQALRWGIGPFIVPKFGHILDKSKQQSSILSILLVTVFILLVIIPLHIPLVVWLPIVLIHVLLSSVLIMVMDAFVGDFAAKVPSKILIMTAYTIIIDLGAALGPITGYALEQDIGLTGLFWLAAGVCVVLSIIWWIPKNHQIKQNRFENI